MYKSKELLIFIELVDILLDQNVESERTLHRLILFGLAQRIGNIYIL